MGIGAMLREFTLRTLRRKDAWLEAGRGAGPWSRLAVIERVLLPTAILALSWRLRPEDPLGLHAAFPWIWLGPWLVAVRYGAAAGMVGAGLYAAFWSLAPRLFGVPMAAAFPSEFFLGGVLVTLVLGEFGSVMLRREALQRALALDLGARLERTKRRLFIVKESLASLEQELIDRPVTLRDALLDLRRIFAFSVGNARRPGARAQRPLPDPDAFLLLLSQSCRLLEAGVFVLEPRRGRGRAAVAGHWRLGHALGQELPSFDAGHPLIQRALQTREAVHVAQERASDAGQSVWVFAAPLRLAETGEVDAVLAVHSMPFMSFEEQNLQRLQVLCASYLDFSLLESGVAEFRAAWEQAPIGLQQEWAQLSRLHAQSRLRSYCVVWTGADWLGPEELAEFSANQPLNSSTWTFGGETSRVVLVVLLPLYSVAALAQYRRDMFELSRQIAARDNWPQADALSLEVVPVQGADGLGQLRGMVESVLGSSAGGAPQAERQAQPGEGS
jgi:hypothetical protein